MDSVLPTKSGITMCGNITTSRKGNKGKIGVWLSFAVVVALLINIYPLKVINTAGQATGKKFIKLLGHYTARPIILINIDGPRIFLNNVFIDNHFFQTRHRW